MQDVEQLRRELEAMSPEDRTDRIAAEQEKARHAQAAGDADPAAVDALRRIAEEHLINGLGEATPAEPAGIRARLLELTAELVDEAGKQDTPSGAGTYALVIESLAGALDAVDQVWRREQAAAPRRAMSAPPAYEELLAAVWNATQEAGAPTAAGDAAVQVLRDAWEPR